MATFIKDLDVLKPTDLDAVADGASEIRDVKNALQNTFPQANSALNVSNESINQAIQQDIPDIKNQLGQIGGGGSGGNGVFASCKWDGTQLTYAQNISGVDPIDSIGYKVSFIKPTDGFDDHYAIQATPIASNSRPVMIQVTAQTSEFVAFTLSEWDGGTLGAPTGPVGFYMTMIDMIQVGSGANS